MFPLSNAQVVKVLRSVLNRIVVTMSGALVAQVFILVEPHSLVECLAAEAGLAFELLANFLVPHCLPELVFLCCLFSLARVLPE